MGKRVKKELQYFCDETSIHGFKYTMDNGSSTIRRILWLIVLFISFTYAAFMLHSSFVLWHDEPTINVVLSTTHPIEKVDFPTVTICPADPNPDRWGLVVKIFDQMQIQCFKDNGPKFCQGLGKTFDTFEGFFKSLTYQIRQEIINKASTADASTMEKDQKSVGIVQDSDIYNAIMKISSNAQITEQFLQSLWNDLGDFPGKIADNGKDVVLKYAFEETIKKASSIQTNPEFDCFQDPECEERMKKFTYEFIAISAIFAKNNRASMGQLLSHFKHKIGDYFKKNYPWPQKPLSESQKQLEEEFTELLVDLAFHFSNGSLKEVSLLDLPAFGAFYMPERDGKDPFKIGEKLQLNHAIKVKQSSISCNLIGELETLVNAWIKNESDPTEMKNDCFNFTAYLEEDMKTFLIALKESFLIGDGIRNTLFFREVAKKVFSDVIDHNVMLSNTYYDQLFIKCSYGEMDWTFNATETCSLFQPILTNKGLCYSFNNGLEKGTLRDSFIVDSFQEAFNERLEIPRKKFLGVGNDQGMSLIINCKGFTEEHGSMKSLYTIGISSPINQFDQLKYDISVRPGYYTTLTIVPEEIESSDEFKGLGLSSRNCKYPEENQDMRMMKKYSRRGCEMECAANYGIELCNCLPWNYPNAGNRVPMCDMFGSHCFDTIIKHSKNYKQCTEDCLEDCELTSMMVFPSQRPLEHKELCSEDFFFEFFTVNREKLEANIIESYNHWIHGSEKRSTYEFCEHYLKHYVAIVDIGTPTHSVTRSSRDKRVTFGDQLATIGGTLGLFSGMSLLSIVEIICWLSRCFKK